MEAARYGHEAILKLLLESSEIQVNPVDKEVPSALILAARYGREGAVRLLLACPDIQVNLVDNQGVSALMEAARVGHDGVVRLLLSHPDTLLGSIDKKKWSALRLPIPIKWETSGGLRLAVLPHVDAASRRAAEGHAAMSLALVGGHMGIVQLLEQFDSRKASLHSADLTLKDVGRLDHLESGEPINEESESERDSEERQVIEEWLIGDGTMDMDTGNAYCLAADYDGADNLPPDEPSDSRRGVKRSRGEEDVNSQSPVDYMAAPASKRHRGEAVEEDP
ncbi:ankyrin repeat-containing domain protein [Coprinopsis sp. MPI-PUGE-AT-0042]|nr:ankyrin repeat-containing domain protein [Coprinopsis sp. MPI-PUGE-AT-0042]